MHIFTGSYKWNRFFLSIAGLISPGVSVPVQVPGGVPPQDHTAHMSMGSMTSQYWPRIQWHHPSVAVTPY